MAVKYLIFLAFAVALVQGQSVTEITLADQSFTFLTNDLIGKSLAIPMSFLDFLVSCHVVFPNGQIYEAFPNNEIPQGSIQYLYAASPFTSCGIGFLGADVSLSGTYELMSLVRHRADDSRTMTRQRFHLTLIPLEE